MSSPAVESDSGTADDLLRVESDITGSGSAQAASSSEHGDSAPGDSEADLLPKRTGKKHGVRFKNSEPKAAKKATMKPAPTVVRMGDNDDSGGTVDDVTSDDSELPALSDIVKPASKQSVVAPKKRGRPAKVQEPQEVADPDDQPKKKIKKYRGYRQPDVHQDEKQVAGSDNEPKKKNMYKKKLQSDRQSDNNQEEHKADVLALPAQSTQPVQSVPRRRGRPPKSKPSASKATAAATTPDRPVRAAAESARSSIAAQSTKRQLRRRNDSSPAAAKPERRGRPKKLQVYSVEKIIDSKVKRDGSKIYLVKWVNYDASQSTWEPVSNLEGCMKSVEAYDKKAKAGAKKT